MTGLRLSHGGALADAVARYGRQADDWVDLSTGLNPWPWPVDKVVMSPDIWARLPEEADLRRLEAAAAACYGAPGDTCLTPAPGTQMLIQWLPYLVPPDTVPGGVAVPGPAYEEHAWCWRQAGHDVCEVTSLEEAASCDVVIVVNPNNPDGRLFDPERLRSLADRLARRGGLLVVDEAFADGDAALTCVSDAGRPGLCILRSFGKFFGLGGLRLGFAMTDPALGMRLRAALGPWAVSGPAVAVGCSALEDASWIEAAVRRLDRESCKLADTLQAAGFRLAGGTRFFQLIHVESAVRLYDHLARRGILTRRFEPWPHWLRIGLPPHAAARSRLAKALEEWHE